MGPFRLRGFEDLELLGQGGFGAVYRATRVSDRRRVAVKVLQLPTDGNLRRFIRERNMLHEQVRNDHVVKLLSSDLDHKPPFIVLELCVTSLRPWVSDRQPWQNVAIALLHAATGLHGVHELGGFHRDVKPDNLLVAEVADGHIVKLGDFGLARTPLITSGPMTRSPGARRGTSPPR